MSAPSRLPSIRRPGGGTNGGKSRPMSMIEGSLGFSLTGGSTSQSSSSKSTTKTSKRRSLLPQFSSSKKGSMEKQPEIQEADEDSSLDKTSTSSNEANLAITIEGGKSTTAAPHPVNRHSRPLTMYVGGTANASRLPGTRTSSMAHSRGLSTTSIRPSTRDEALATLDGTPSVGPRISSRVDVVSHRPVNNMQHVSRQSSTSRSHARTNSSMTVSSIGGTHEKRASVSSIRPPSSSQSSPPRNLGHRSQMPAPSRPAFNTYQQHYSPAKSTLAKPLVSTNRAARSQSIRGEDTLNGLSSEQCLHAQVELLQLSLMHQAAVESMQDFDASAKQKLSRKHAKLRKDYESVRLLEQEQRRISNLAALDAWTPHADLLVENLHILGKVKTEIDLMTTRYGAYAELMSIFEEWIEEVEASYTREPVAFADGLPESWHASHESSRLKVRALQKELESLPRPPRGHADKSSIAILLGSCRSMLADMVKELELMTQLEQGVLSQEKRRLDDDIVSLGLKRSASAQVSWTPAWQSVST